MRVIGIVFGLLFIGIGITAVAGGNIDDVAPWFFAGAIACLGIGGLIGALRAKRSAATS